MAELYGNEACTRSERNAELVHGIQGPACVSAEDRAAIDACVAKLKVEAVEMQARIDRASAAIQEVVRNMPARTEDPAMNKTQAMDWLIAAIIIVAPTLLLVWAYYR